jgi:hypothetical protein
MKSIVSLGQFIFKSRFVDNILRNKLTEFSEHLHDFNFHYRRDETEVISEMNCPDEEDDDLFGEDTHTANFTSSSMKQYCKELADMETNSVDEEAGHELNITRDRYGQKFPGR